MVITMERLQSLERVRTQYPRDRVVLNQIARLLFLKREYAMAIETLQAVNAIDPEDVQMHYTWMLSSRGLGRRGQRGAGRKAVPPV